MNCYCLWAVQGGTKSIQASQPNLLVVVSPKPLFLLVSAAQLTATLKSTLHSVGARPNSDRRKICRVAKFPSKCPASLYLLGGFWVEIADLWALEPGKGCCSPLPAGQRDTFEDTSGAPAGHLQPLQLVPQVVPSQCQRLIHSRGSLEGTCKPHLGEATPVVLLYELHCSETQRDRMSFLQFQPRRQCCNEGEHSSRSNRLLSLWAFSCQAWSISKDGGFETPPEQPLEWLSSPFHVPVTVFHSLVLLPC